MACQYCAACGAVITPLYEDVLVGSFECRCGETIHLNELRDTQLELTRQLYRDVQALKRFVQLPDE